MREDDDVDLVIDAWADALPDLDFAPLDVLSRLRRLSPRVQEVRRLSFAAGELAPWEFELLSLLRQDGFQMAIVLDEYGGPAQAQPSCWP